MKILMLAPKYMGLDEPIRKELTAQGHHVVCIEDRMLDFDYHHPWRGWHDRALRAIRCRMNRSFERYWKERIEADERLSMNYDLFFCINGCSFHPFLLSHLLKANPRLRRILYLWDDSGFYDYFHNAPFFDQITTYDLNDSEKYGVGFLPFYWCPVGMPRWGGENYDISIVGTNHDNRLQLCREIAKQASPDRKLFFRIIDKTLPESDMVIHKPIPIEQVNDIIRQSRCILDTDRASQSGTTPRVIWALALGKKVITTNRNIVRMPFFSMDAIQVIDRNHPRLDWNFVDRELDTTLLIRDQLDQLRINNWVRRLIL